MQCPNKLKELKSEYKPQKPWIVDFSSFIQIASHVLTYLTQGCLKINSVKPSTNYKWNLITLIHIDRYWYIEVVIVFSFLILMSHFTYSLECTDSSWRSLLWNNTLTSLSQGHDSNACIFLPFFWLCWPLPTQILLVGKNLVSCREQTKNQ